MGSIPSNITKFSGLWDICCYGSKDGERPSMRILLFTEFTER
jgi:hypothetical protein